MKKCMFAFALVCVATAAAAQEPVSACVTNPERAMQLCPYLFTDEVFVPTDPAMAPVVELKVEQIRVEPVVAEAKSVEEQ